MKRVAFFVSLLLFVATDAAAQQFPVLDAIADRVVQKYQNSSCQDLMAQRDQPRGPEEQHAVQLLRDDPQMRHEFISRVAAPIAEKLFECRMIP